MIELVLIFMITWLVSWPALVVFFVFSVWSEHKESRGLAVFWALVAVVSSYFYFNVSLLDIAIYSVIYVVIGVVWSFYRYKRFIVAKVEELSITKSTAIYYHPTKMLDTITAWIIIWPISLTENLCSDIINGVETLVKKVFKSVYIRIYDSAIKNVNFEKD
jgi:hypothetical protein